MPTTDRPNGSFLCLCFLLFRGSATKNLWNVPIVVVFFFQICFIARVILRKLCDLALGRNITGCMCRRRRKKPAKKKGREKKFASLFHHPMGLLRKKEKEQKRKLFPYICFKQKTVLCISAQFKFNFVLNSDLKLADKMALEPYYVHFG